MSPGGIIPPIWYGIIPGDGGTCPNAGVLKEFWVDGTGGAIPGGAIPGGAIPGGRIIPGGYDVRGGGGRGGGIMPGGGGGG